MEIFVARQFPALCTTWRVSELLQNVLRDFHVPWHWAFFSRHEWWLIPTQNRARNIKQYISQNYRGARGEPLIASKSSIVVSSGIAFTALDLITRPYPFRATMCSSVWKRSPSHVPRCHLNITAVPNGKRTPRCSRLFNRSYADLPSLATWNLFTVSVACSAIHGNTGGDGTPNSPRKIKNNHFCHLLN